MKETFELLEYVLPAHRDESVGNSEEEITEKETGLGIKFPQAGKLPYCQTNLPASEIKEYVVNLE